MTLNGYIADSNRKLIGRKIFYLDDNRLCTGTISAMEGFTIYIGAEEYRIGINAEFFFTLDDLINHITENKFVIP